MRVIHYDRNLGKGYAIKVGASQAEGSGSHSSTRTSTSIPLRSRASCGRAECESLDFVIGSKRHPDSLVHYPRSRRIASWLYQQLVRLLFRLDVRDTQVGLKVFRREVADEVLPLLLVKRFAFDLELLAVARSLGFARIEEQPIDLHYRFTGSGVGSLAVLLALVDTAAIFYRLRILHYYRRRQRLAGPYRSVRPAQFLSSWSPYCRTIPPSWRRLTIRTSSSFSSIIAPIRTLQWPNGPPGMYSPSSMERRGQLETGCRRQRRFSVGRRLRRLSLRRLHRTPGAYEPSRPRR